MGLSKVITQTAPLELSRISNQELLGRMDKLVRTERKITHLILCHINEFESRKLYADLGFDSMFKYLTTSCGYGEDSAYRRLQAARLLKKNPLIAEKLEDGSVNLTQLTHVQKCIKQEHKSGAIISSEQTLKILEQIQNKSSYETKKVLAVEFNQPIKDREIVKPQRDDSVRIEITLSENQMQLLNEAKDLLSHVIHDGNLADVITFLAKAHIKKIKGKDMNTVADEEAAFVNINSNTYTDRESKTEIETSKGIHKNSDKVEGLKSSASTAKGTVSRSAHLTPSFTATRKRPVIRNIVRRALLRKAHHCCEYIDPKTGAQCRSTYQLQIDHKIPFALGGSNESENLQVLCRTHNLQQARHWGLKVSNMNSAIKKAYRHDL